MKISRKLSQQGLFKVKRRLANLGWKIYGDRAALEASKILEPKEEWKEGGPYAYGSSLKTWENFLARKPIKERTFNTFCSVLAIDPNDVARDRDKVTPNLGEVDLVQAPDLETFYGREQELVDLKKWILENRCRLISIIGFAGIGKTQLSLKLARQVGDEFEYIIWRKLYDTLPLESLLKELIKFVSDGEETELASTTGGLTQQLLRYLNEQRCLVVLDNIESVCQSGDPAGGYQEKYEDFFRRIGSSKHLSCVLLTSRVKFSYLEMMEGLRSVRSLKLQGLDTEAGRKVFQNIAPKLDGNFQEAREKDWQHLISSYQGNPLALEVAARHVFKIYGGNLAQFLEHDLRMLEGIKQLFNWHFGSLTADEKTVIYWLALNREGILIDELREYLVFDREKRLLPQTLEDLDRKIPIEKSGDRLTLHSLLMEYTTERAIEKVCQELTSGKLQLFNSHALIQASAKDYIKDEQIRLILQPIIDHLRESFGLEQNYLENQLLQLLKNLNRKIPGYTVGNLINLMQCAGIPINGYDFSGMTIWSADFDINLPKVNFAGCKFARCSFAQNFKQVSAIAFHPQQESIAVADHYGVIRLFSRCGQIDLVLREKDYVEITDLTFSPEGKLLASSNTEDKVKLWDLDTGELSSFSIRRR